LPDHGSGRSEKHDVKKGALFADHAVFLTLVVEGYLSACGFPRLRVKFCYCLICSIFGGQKLRSFFEELRYRNVFRVGIAYVIAGWLIAQVADLAADAFNAPDWFMQMLIVVLLLGLPVALFLAWAYELTPDGLKRAKDLPEDAPKDPRSGHTLNRLTIVSLVIAVTWLSWDKLHDPGDNPDAATTIDKSIAVLPFDDFSPDSDQVWFADGLTEEILNSLARTDDLHVASRTSSFAYRGTTENLSDIAAALGVAHILEGSVRRAGDQLRVTAQLIRASDDKHLWSETYDGGIENSIEIQEQIATDIARALKTAMDPEELARMIGAGTRSVEAWETYLHGLALRNARSESNEWGQAFEIAEVFDEAVAIDPAFIDAHQALVSLWLFQLSPNDISYVQKGPPYAERRARFDAALEASIRHARNEEDRLEAEIQKALVAVRYRDVIRLSEQLVALEPSYWLWSDLLEYYQWTGQRDKAIAAGHAAWARVDIDEADGNFVIYNMRRVDLDQTVEWIDERLARDNLPALFYYQAHRALLDAGLVERAARLIPLFERRSADMDGAVMMKTRQACAEGRVEDAEAEFASIDPDSNTRWLFLKTLGRDDDARELLRPLDTPERLFQLAAFLEYRVFDVREYPRLAAALRADGIERVPVRPQTFTCAR
jgi:TolB-like protein